MACIFQASCCLEKGVIVTLQGPIVYIIGSWIVMPNIRFLGCKHVRI